MSADPSRKSAFAAFDDEAESRAERISATRDAVGEWTRWLRVPPVSGLECVQALWQEGYRLVARHPGCVEIRRHDLTLQVPLADRLDPDVLIALLIKARVGPVRFLELLDSGQ
jgi:hypothetical protein